MAPRVLIEPHLGEADAALILLQRVVQPEAEVDLVVQAGVARALPVRVIRKAVDMQIKTIESAIVGERNGRRAEKNE
jgi:hypothetical protein